MKIRKRLSVLASNMVFSKWSGKRNSVFLSLKRQIRIAVLPLSYFLLNAFTVQAQTDTIKIQEVRVSAYRNEVSFKKVPRIVQMTQAGEIEVAPLNTINDVLKSLMNVDVRDRGAFGVQSDLNIRGGSFEQNVVLINGVKMNDPQTGHFQMNLPLDLVDVERIELLNGSSSSLFGNNAFSGAINIITGLKSENTAKLALMAGEHALFGANASINLSSKSFKNYLSVSKKISDGHMYNTDFDIFNLYYNSKLVLKPGTLQVQAGFLDKSFGANSFYTPKFPEQFEQNKTILANLNFSSNTDSNFKYTSGIYWRRNFDRFELFRYEAPAWYTNHNYHISNVLGMDINTRFSTFFGKTAIGVDLNAESILSNKLGEELSNPKPIQGEDNLFYTHGKTRQNISAFIENQLEFNKILVSARLMANWNSMFDWNYYPGIDLAYSIAENMSLFTSVNWSGRLPSFTDLYYSGPANIGNSNLKPEKAITYDLGMKYFGKKLIVQSSVFLRNGKDIIDWVKQNPEDLWQSMNLTSVESRGFEFSAKWQLNSNGASHFFVHSIGINYSFIDMDKESGDHISQYVLDYLKHSAGISISHKLIKHFSVFWQFNYQQRNGTYFPFNSSTNLFELPLEYEPLYMVDLKLNYNLKRIDCYIQVKNLFDVKHQNIENVQLPGRWISGGMSLTLNLKAKK